MLTGQKTIFLLGIDICDEALLGLEVEHHLGLLILVASHLEHRGSRHLMRRGIHLSRCIDQVAVETHTDILAGEVHVLVFHRRTAIEEGARGAGLVDEGVVGCIFHGGVDTILSALVDAVAGQGVVNNLIIFIDGQFQGIHLRGVALGLDSRLLIGRNHRIDRHFVDSRCQ